MFRLFILCLMLVSVSSVSAQNQTKLRILTLGDSYTIGQSVAVDKRWPVQLVGALEKNKLQTSVDIIAATGWTTIELEQAIAAASLNTPYDLVTLLIGVNDQFRGGSIEAYTQNFKRLLQASIRYANGQKARVVVVSIPDYGVTPFARRFNPQAISCDIDAFNAVNKRLSLKAGVHYVDITPISREALKDNRLLADDGLHPSALMYQKWIEKLLPIAEQILKKP